MGGHAGAGGGRRSRTPLVVEAVPLGAGLAFLLLVLLSWVTPHEGAGSDIVRAVAFFVLWSAVVTGGGLFLLFFLSGVGWIVSGHAIAGFAIMGGRLCLSLAIFVIPVYGGRGGAESLAYFFVASMAMAAGSTVALAMVREREARRVVA